MEEKIYGINQEVLELINKQNINQDTKEKCFSWILKAQNQKNKNTFKVKKIAKDLRYSTIKNRATWISIHTLILYVTGNQFVNEVEKIYEGRTYLSLNMVKYKGKPMQAHHLNHKRKDNNEKNIAVVTEDCHQDIERTEGYALSLIY